MDARAKNPWLIRRRHLNKKLFRFGLFRAPTRLSQRPREPRLMLASPVFLSSWYDLCSWPVHHLQRPPSRRLASTCRCSISGRPRTSTSTVGSSLYNNTVFPQNDTFHHLRWCAKYVGAVVCVRKGSGRTHTR